MQIDLNLVSQIEKLARLELSHDEREGLRKDLNHMLQMVDKMSEVDTDNVDPLIYMTEVLNNWREDNIEKPLSQKLVLKNAPKSDGSHFMVPKVIGD